MVPNGVVSLKESVNDAVPLASGGDIVLLPQAKRFAELASYAWASASATPPSFTACHVTVTKTVLVIVEVLSVQDMVALDSPPYAAAGSAEASARSKAIPRATRSRRFIDIPSICSQCQQSGFPIQGSIRRYAAQLHDNLHHDTLPSAMAPLQ